MRKIVVTDLTRFSNQDILCTAGIDVDSGQCIRPLPYLNANRCKELNMLPGAILTGHFSETQDIANPHIEDMNYQNLKFCGHCSSNEFRKILFDSSSTTVEQGFGVELLSGQKCISIEQKPIKSLITISVDSAAVKIIPDGYKPEKIKIHLTDSSGKEYRYLPITDYGLHRYAEKHFQTSRNYLELNNLIRLQREVFLRIGLSRFYQAPNGQAGFWMQLNGIYSFPDYFKEARQYG